MKHLDLFSGIGGFALGLESTGHFETVAFCEIDPFCRKVLHKRWPNVEVVGDIYRIGGLSLSGFIGRWETPRARRATEQLGLRPDWVVIENEGHRWRQWVPELRRRLWERGYASLPLRVRADYLGFPHRRARVLIIAHADSIKLRELKGWWLGEGRQVAAELAKPEDYAPRGLGADDGLSDWTHRRAALGNAVVPLIAELIGYGIAAVDTPHP